MSQTKNNRRENILIKYSEGNPRSRGKLYNEIVMKDVPKSRTIDAKLYKKISEKKPQDQRQQARKYTMKLKPQGSENKEVILYNINRQKEKKISEIIKQNHKQK